MEQCLCLCLTSTSADVKKLIARRFVIGFQVLGFEASCVANNL